MPYSDGMKFPNTEEYERDWRRGVLKLIPYFSFYSNWGDWLPTADANWRNFSFFECACELAHYRSQFELHVAVVGFHFEWTWGWDGDGMRALKAVYEDAKAHPERCVPFDLSPAGDAVDPHASSTGKSSTREGKSS